VFDQLKTLKSPLGPSQSDTIGGAEGRMTQAPWDDNRLKELLKTALVEVLEERKEVLQDLLEEALQDVALARAINQGQGTKDVSRSEIFSILEGGH
jgi:hypothetical protein